MLRLVFIVIALNLCANVFINATLTPKSKKSTKNHDRITAKSGPHNLTVFDRNLVTMSTSPKDILQNYKAFFKETDEYSFKGLVLGYVTPWNNHGYDIGKIFGNKFTHISPVWLELRRKSPKAYEIKGTHDVDKDWMAHVRNAGRERHIKIVPRLLFGGLTGDDFNDIFHSSKEIKALIKAIIHNAKNYDFDGFVLEIWPQFEVEIEYDPLLNLVKAIGDALAVDGLDMILVIPPKRGHNIPFTEAHFNKLYKHVTAFSLMTYDYSNPRKPGPNAPLSWVEDCIRSVCTDEKKRAKILTGLNFYGNHYHEHGGKPIVAHEYIKILEENGHGKLMYDAQIAEHYLEFE
ncbi:chitinase domain-containing protein 1 [Asbolus verrucosus]|uniref:Chitinase domain-containing protein 1 n=1 Tax=Asbolus verrucosus TaxID=1661398 RepID=A0A482VXC9_ASBVE|nr:chitinase domain-containing protein 1 [Asbolus verrucosus]